METETGGIPEESRCVENWLHDYRIVDQDESCVYEVCRKCNKRQHFRIINDQADSNGYLNHHIRQALTPNHPLFYHEWWFEKEILNEFIYD